MSSPCFVVKINLFNNNFSILLTNHFPLPKVVCRTESSGPFTGCNILTVFSQVVLEDVQHNNTTRVTELSSSTTEWGVSSTVKNNGFLVPWRLFPLSPIATGATFQGRETLKKNTRKVEEWEGKLVLTVHSS